MLEYDCEEQALFSRRVGRRVGLGSAKAALNGYQKGHCFYCFGPISIQGQGNMADVDHFFPWSLARHIGGPVDGIWNLVLACRDCNRGTGGKFDQVPRLSLVERLHRRNEFYVESNHKLRTTLVAQTGGSEAQRQSFLQLRYEEALRARPSDWVPRFQAAKAF
jgi:5-methylcytosine-specific restriction endonuclease McrA